MNANLNMGVRMFGAQLPRMVTTVTDTLVSLAEREFTPEEHQQFSAWLRTMRYSDRCELLDALTEMNRSVLIFVAPFDADNMAHDIAAAYAVQLDHLAAA